MSELTRFRVVYEEEAGEFIIAQTGQKRRKLADIAYAIAKAPLPSPITSCPTLTAARSDISPPKAT